MKERFLIFAALIFLIIILIGLNAASFVQEEKIPDSEANPNRSTYNFGATGTRAFYELLAETGKEPVRWTESPDALSVSGKSRPLTFVLIGKTRREITNEEIEQLLHWVSTGGKLVIIDRKPPDELIKTTANWLISTTNSEKKSFFDADPSNHNQMTEGTTAAKPVQPGVFTAQVSAVAQSRFASEANIERLPGENNFKIENTASNDESVTSVVSSLPTTNAETSAENDYRAPGVHLAGNDKNLLVDFPFGSGQIVYLTDPYIVSNGGINLADNAQLAINIVSSRGGTIAFDEFHQGYGKDDKQILTYFAGTPIIAIFLQLLVLVGLIFYTQSRRFARPLPESEPNRLSKLEYVSAMAELQRRTKAYDLAIENIYTEFRRQTARLVSADNSIVARENLAGLIAERAKLNAAAVESLMFKCEEIIRGEPTDKREFLEIARRLREIEEKLGLRRPKKQFFKK